MNKSVWEWLEIEPTQDISAIKSAYAKQVKVYHPEDKPEEFKELQKAYKSAVKLARLQKSESVTAVLKETNLENAEDNIEQEVLQNEQETEKQASEIMEQENVADGLKIQEEEKETFDFGETQGNRLSEQFFRELENLTMYPYTRNNLAVWEYFLEKEKYQPLYSDADMCQKIQDKICSMWGYNRKTLLFWEDWLTKKGTCSFTENKKWKKKKSWIRNIHIISFKTVTLRPQLDLNKILENQASCVEYYTELYLAYAEQKQDIIYKYYRSNKRAFIGFTIGAICMIVILSIAIKVNIDLAEEKQSEKQYNQEYIESLKESVNIQKSE